MTISIAIAYLFSGKSTILVTQHSNLSIRGCRRVCQKVRSSEPFWGRQRRGDRKQVRGGSSQGEQCISREGKCNHSRWIVTSEWSYDAVWRVDIQLNLRKCLASVLTWTEAPPLYPVWAYRPEGRSASDRLGPKFCTQFRAAACPNELVVPLT